MIRNLRRIRKKQWVASSYGDNQDYISPLRFKKKYLFIYLFFLFEWQWIFTVRSSCPSQKPQSILWKSEGNGTFDVANEFPFPRNEMTSFLDVVSFNCRMTERGRGGEKAPDWWKQDGEEKGKLWLFYCMVVRSWLPFNGWTFSCWFCARMFFYNDISIFE